MSVEQEIIDYFTRRIEENMEQILKAFRFFLNDELYQKLVDKIDKIVPVFYVDKKGIEKCLESGLSPEEERLLEYFEDKIDANPQRKINGEKYVINENLEQKYSDYINSHEGEFTSCLPSKNIIYYMINICDGGLMYAVDINLIHCYLDIILRRNADYLLPREDFTDPYEKETYKILKEKLAILIYRKLRDNNTYILDNKEHSANPNIDEVDQEFFANFSDLINLFLQSPLEFINIVGKDNFNNFAHLYVKNYNSEYIESYDTHDAVDKDEIEEAIEAMAKYRASKMHLEIMYIDIPTIEKMLDQYRQKKESQVNSADSVSKHLEYLAFLQRCRGNRRGIYKKDINIIDDIEIIDNKIDNQKIIDDTYNVDSTNFRKM